MCIERPNLFVKRRKKKIICACRHTRPCARRHESTFVWTARNEEITSVLRGIGWRGNPPAIPAVVAHESEALPVLVGGLRRLERRRCSGRRAVGSCVMNANFRVLAPQENVSVARALADVPQFRARAIASCSSKPRTRRK
jgi:hypothetical protein